MANDLPDGLDPECLSLYLAMNAFPGIQTVGSCCGHGKRPFWICFRADSLEALPPLLYWTDVCHTGCAGWRVIVQTDFAMSPASFYLEGPAGAYGDANTIAEKMTDWLKEEGLL